MRRSRSTVVLVTLALLLASPLVHARDYDVQSAEWNGLQELIRVAQLAEVDLRPTAAIEWAEIRRGDGLLILYPRSSVDLTDLSSFLEDGGRLALMDDFGDAAPLLQWFQVTRSEEVRGRPRSAELPGLLIAFKRTEHPLSEGVDALTTNEPVVLSHPRLSPVFALSDDPHQGIVLAGQVGQGRLVIGGDPSVLINSMLRFHGNRQFATNLLRYLAHADDQGHPRGRVHLVHSAFASHGMYRGRGRPQTASRELVQNIDEALNRLSVLGGDAAVVRVLALVMAALAMLSLGVRSWGSRPNDRFGPTGPSGAAAGVAEKVAIFSLPAANMLYPSLIAKRYFERALLRAVGLKPPTDIGAVLLHAKGRLDEEHQAELRAVLVDLDALSTPAHEGGPARVSSRRFLSLWKRIGAILTHLGDRRS